MQTTAEPIVNRVAQSGIISFNIEDYRPQGGRALFDIKDWLYMELVLKEDDFRAHVKAHDWAQYQDAHVALQCSADAIVPAWAYMLVASALSPFAKTIIFGDLDDLELHLYQTAFSAINFSEFENKRVVVKGCGHLSPALYVAVTTALRPYAHAIMFGEPCSTVPIYKKSKA